MGNRLSVASVIEKNKLGSDVPYLAFLEIGVLDRTTGSILETLRFVNNTEDIKRNGATYTAAQFSLELKAETGTQPQIMLSVLDYARVLLQKMQDNSGGTGFPVTVIVCSADNLNGTPEVQEYFEVVNASATNYTVSWTLGAENGLQKMFPKRIQRRDFCQWVYRDGSTCRYNGPMQVCDRTMEGTLGCRAHGNVINFGGYPNLVSSNSVTR
ncbi:hypothetical protein ACTJLD_21960 [Burkholderia sp. 22088]|uniref:hypothetical protein n=1 Tax=Burkholderia sp. 22088 TaxID=3453871 RepID=UPI003F856B9E